MRSEILKSVVSYWYECIRQEDILGKDISINVRSKAVLYPFEYDYLIFNRKEESFSTTNPKLLEFYNYSKTKGFDNYYGYPILFYFNENENKFCVASLFIIKIQLNYSNGQIIIQKDEPIPACGILALEKLGLKTEEIADINNKIEELFKDSASISNKELAKKALSIIENETFIQINEEIDPNNLSNKIKLSKNSLPGLYNKSLIFLGDNTIYNLSLLEDLLELKSKNDLDETSLSFLLSQNKTNNGEEIIPILPFPANEYQIVALQDIFINKISVITGPPGTGKSQFISNLIVNLFLAGKSVLFVSHTNPAVEVVNKKINSNFFNLMFRTGRKDLRQELKGRFNDLILELQKDKNYNINRKEIINLWEEIKGLQKKILKIYDTGAQLEKGVENYISLKNTFYNDKDLENSFSEIDEVCLFKVEKILQELKRLNDKSFSFIEKFLLIFNRNYINSKEKRFIQIINKLLPTKCLRVIRNFEENPHLNKWSDNFSERFKNYKKLYENYNYINSLKSILSSYPSKFDVEKQILDLKEKYFQHSNSLVKNIYLKEIFHDKKKIGFINAFFDSIESTSYNQNSEKNNDYFFIEALSALRIWSCTLKSLRRTFPLIPAAFDFVIFDEASQVDLPSAAPALYRAKNAIIVGDPNQLSHIASITKEMDTSIAKSFNLLSEKELYPQKIRYCDISLYKSAENSLVTIPILLSNHYRSEDQIINLCNNVFYGGKLKIKTNLDYSNYPKNLKRGLHWIDCKGEVIKYPTGSRVNYIEAKLVKEIFMDIIKEISSTNLEVGIVTPYSKQQDTIYDLITKDLLPETLEKHNVEILTAHKFQGSEKDIMIFSLVLASKGNGNSDRWYNIYPQILNVSLSRAKYLLYIIGDKEYCRQRDGYLKKLIDAYDELKQQENIEEYYFHKKFDTNYEQLLFETLIKSGIEKLGYKILPKVVVKRYTLDIALLGEKKINIECDGFQHEIIRGLPIIEDIERDEFLKNEGWIVKRFYNYEIINEIDKVVDTVFNVIKKEKCK